MASKTQASIMVLGPGDYTIDGVAVGHVLKGSLKIPSATVSGTTGQYGDASVAEFHNPQNPMLEIEFAQVDLPIYQKAIQEATLSTSGSDEVLTGGKSAGGRITPVEIIYTPISSSISASRSLKCWYCVPVGEPELVFALEQQMLKASFKLLVKEAATEGEKFFKFGTTSVSTDTSAPTVSSTSPADGATGVSATAAKTITFDAAIDEATVTGLIGAGNVFLVAATSTSVAVPVACTLSYNTATFTVSITPNSALGGTTEYDLMLTTGIKDAAGNRFAGAKYSFTTA